MSSSASLLIPLHLLLVLLSYGSTSGEATDAPLCAGRCGVHNISHPFRLTDSPAHCGDMRYNLSCENNQLVLYWKSGRYYVQSINYNNYTIRIADASIRQHDYSSLPRRSLATYNFSYPNETYQHYQYSRGTPVRYNILTKLMVYFSCPYPVDSSDHDTATCMNSSYSLGSPFYVSVNDESLSDLGLGDSCRIELMYVTSWPGEKDHSNISCRDIHNMLLYGFELSWLISFCPDLSSIVELDDHNLPYCLPRSGLCSQLIRIAEDYMLGIGAGLYDIARRPPIMSLDGPVSYVGGKVTGIFILPLRLLFGTVFLFVLLIHRWRRRHFSAYQSIEVFLQGENLKPIRYSYREIKSMTRGFRDKLGEGGFGSVYKGKLRSGPFVAIKMLDKSKTNGQDFVSEVATIGRIHHQNVVQLVGFCVEGSKRALVYEFMPSGSLDKYIFSKEGNVPLSYDKIYEISLGVARGIDYLHKGCDMQILHFDIKPHNILLAENFTPKVSDFGLAKLYPIAHSIVTLTEARGTIGYMAPELFYKNIGGVSYKADVYSFGMLLMEMAGRRKNLNPHAENSSQLFFPLWIYDQFNEEKDIILEDVTEEQQKLVKKMIIVALWCIQLKPRDRPSMSKVVEMLEGEVEHLEMPPKPSLYPEEMFAENDGISSHQTVSSDSISSTSYPAGEIETDPILENSA